MKAKQLYLHIINNLSEGVYYVDAERRIVFWNKAAEEISGYTAEEVVGRKCEDNLLNHIDTEGRPLCIVGCPLYATMIDNQQRKEVVFLRHKSGYRLPVTVHIIPVVEDGRTIGAIELFSRTVSPVVYNDDLVEQLSDSAMTDELTGLPNRRYMSSILEFQINEYARFKKPFALLFMDIDNFSRFNNQHGHEMGDVVLKSIAGSIRDSLRKGDAFGRWGGEEFVGIMPVRQSYDAPILGEKVRRLVEQTRLSQETPLSVTASVGVTIVRDDDTMASVLERADQLMYRSKQKGKNRVSSDEQYAAPYWDRKNAPVQLPAQPRDTPA